MEKSTKTRACTGSINSMDQNNKNDDDNASQHQEELKRDALDDLLQMESKYRDTIDRMQESRHQWRIREKGLRCSNWKFELENLNIREQTDRCDEVILTAVEICEKIYDGTVNVKSRNRQEDVTFWNYFQQETIYYSQLFPNAQMEYNSDCLKQDIEISGQISKNIRDTIARVNRNIESAKAKYGLVELGTNKDAKLLQDFDVTKKIISDKSDLIRVTRPAEDNINVLKLTVKQKKHAIAYVKKQLRKKD